MLGWFRQKYKVFLPLEMIRVDYEFGETFVRPAPSLAQWLFEQGCQYKMGYDNRNGTRWIEFTDKQQAAICKLTFG
jgi:hypothetical protein